MNAINDCKLFEIQEKKYFYVNFNLRSCYEFGNNISNKIMIRTYFSYHTKPSLYYTLQIVKNNSRPTEGKKKLIYSMPI